MKKLILGFLLLGSSTLFAQLQMTSMPVPNYVTDVLLGSGVSASNIQFTGCPEQFASFTGGNSVGLGIDAGVVLSTDHAFNLDCSFNSIPFGCQVSGNNDLLTIANSVPPLIGQGFSVGSVNDVAILEFDFVPTGDTLRFNYIFGSDEYMEWVNSSFNDIFAFFLAGPGITGPYSAPAGFPGGSVNIAQVPGSNPVLPITISSVNLNLNSGFYIDNPNNIDVCQDGYTVSLEAWHVVQCGETYHIRLAIADGSDTALESIVILEAGSFSSNAVVDVDLALNVGGPDADIIYEDCGEATLTFTRPEISDLSVQDMAIITWTGTAVNGVDYTLMPDTIIFPPGVQSISFDIDAFVDGLAEGVETVHMDILNLAACNGSGFVSNFDFNIGDLPQPIQVAPFQSDLCLGATLLLEPEVTGGYGNYSYSWSTNETTETISVSPTVSTQYILTVSDTCGWPDGTGTFDINILVFPPLTVSMSASLPVNNDLVLMDCGGSVDFNALAGGGDGVYEYVWTDEAGNDLFGWGSTLFYGSWNGEGEVNVTVTDGCGLTATDMINVAINAPDLTVTIPDTVTAPCLSPFNITANVIGGTPGFSYAWYTNGVNDWDEWDEFYDNFGVATEAQVIVNVSDVCGQTAADTSIISITAPPLVVTLPDQLNGNCTTAFNIQPLITGGSNGFTYSWTNNGVAVASTQNYSVTPGSSTIITLTVNDQCGESNADTVPVLIVNPPVTIDLGPDITSGCTTPNVLTPNLSGGSGGYSYDWFENSTLVGNATSYTALTPVTQPYSVTVIDACDMTDSDTILITIPNPPLILTASPDTAVCVNGTAILSALASGGGGGFTYTWTNNSNGTVATYSDLISPDTYTVTALDLCGQSISEDIFVDVIPVDADFNAENTAGYTYDFMVVDTPPCIGCTYEWTFPDGSIGQNMNETYTFDGFGEASVALTVTNSIGCTASNTFSVTFPPVVYIPNCFTPNGDGLNDVFLVESSSVRLFEMHIFNRWGDEVFNTTDIKEAWIGDDKLKKSYYVPDGVYPYVCKIKGYNGEAEEYVGTITILR